MTRPSNLSVRLSRSDDPAAELLQEMHSLFAKAFGEGFDRDDWDHALGGQHILARDRDSGALVGHAAVIARELLVGGRPYPAGYVEAVSTDPEWQHRGVGRAVMTEVRSTPERVSAGGAGHRGPWLLPPARLGSLARPDLGLRRGRCPPHSRRGRGDHGPPLRCLGGPRPEPADQRPGAVRRRLVTVSPAVLAPTSAGLSRAARGPLAPELVDVGGLGQGIPELGGDPILEMPDVGLIPAERLVLPSPLQPGQRHDVAF